MKLEKRHTCTMCKKKRKEKFLKIVRDSDKYNSKVWICENNCSDGRLNSKVQSYLQYGLSQRSRGLSNDDREKSVRDPTKSKVPGNKFIIDVCCGNKMFWFDKNHKNVIYSDIKSDVASSIVQDFRNIKYESNSFNLVVFDPPHLFKKDGVYSWLNDSYGTLSIDKWPMDIKEGFDECMRILKDYGTLIFKWSSGDISVSTILNIINTTPLFGHTSDKKNRTHWLCFMKLPKDQMKGENNE